mgnify:CR=1 FL=1
MTTRPPDHEYSRRLAKADIRRELVGNGRWSDFVRLREELKERGVPPDVAWQKAYDTIVEDPIDPPDLSDDPPRPVKKVVSKSRPTRQSNSLDASSDVFAEKSCSTPRTVEWVAANISVSDAQASDAPSSEAWSMLCWVKSSPQAESQFWGQIYTKLLPTRQQLDADNRMEDDGRRVLSLIDRIKLLNEVEDDGSE